MIIRVPAAYSWIPHQPAAVRNDKKVEEQIKTEYAGGAVRFGQQKTSP